MDLFGEPILGWGILFLVAVFVISILRKLAKIGCALVIIGILALIGGLFYIRGLNP